VALDYNTHVIDCFHFSLLRNENPVFKFLVHLDKVSPAFLEILQSPIPNLNQSVS